jgi:LysR family glycine cleavage system transcriptional activator
MNFPPAGSLRAFEAAARHEGFAAAAAELNLTAAAVSQHVRALEQWLGLPLFTRHPRGVVLTAAGRDFGTAVSHGLTHIALAAEQLNAKRRRRAVSLACLPSVTTRWLIPRLPRFRAAHPEIQITIVYALDAATPAQAGADLLIQHGLRPDVAAIPILSAATRPTCSPDYVERHGPFEAPATLLRAELLHDETPAAWRRWFAGAGLNVQPGEGPIFADFNLLVGSVLAGQGVGLCPTTLIAEELQTGALRTLFELPADTDKHYWLLEADRLSREAAILRDWVVEMSREPVPPSPPTTGNAR